LSPGTELPASLDDPGAAESRPEPMAAKTLSDRSTRPFTTWRRGFMGPVGVLEGELGSTARDG
jgi:hypothetical protein